MRAARFGDVAAMRVLLDAKADPAVTQKDRTTVLMLAAGAGGAPVKRSWAEPTTVKNPMRSRRRRYAWIEGRTSTRRTKTG